MISYVMTTDSLINYTGHPMPVNYILTEMFLLLQNGDTPLHIESRKGDAKAVKILTRSGANTNIRNSVSFTL